MLFNSIDFARFLPIVFTLYWFVFHKNLQLQNLLLLAASYIFYGWWDWRFLSLIIFSSGLDYIIGLQIIKNDSKEKRRKLLLGLSIAVNLGFLGFFKYFNFFTQSFADAFTLFGQSFDPIRLNILLPVGISFYTFQTLSYSIDVYKRKLKPTNDPIAFFAFVSFFPQLVAGPIERAKNLLPQFSKDRVFSYTHAVDGLRQILWGLFKKMVIADGCAFFVNDIFLHSDSYTGSSLVIGAIFFAFQIYGDFSGYSDIAIGTARLFGFNLVQNFAFPYFSRDIAEFWRRWHISLSTWFRDYLYIPLGGSRGTKLMNIRNIFIIFIVSGFWHGANWTFIAWGAINALLFLPLYVFSVNRKNTDIVAEGKWIPSVKEIIAMGTTFSLTTIAWIFFRAENISHAFQYISTIFSKSIISFPDFSDWKLAVPVSVLIIILLLVEWFGRNGKHALEHIYKLKTPIRWLIYVMIIFLIGMFSQTEETPFIYFQF